MLINAPERSRRLRNPFTDGSLVIGHLYAVYQPVLVLRLERFETAQYFRSCSICLDFAFDLTSRFGPLYASRVAH